MNTNLIIGGALLLTSFVIAFYMLYKFFFNSSKVDYQSLMSGSNLNISEVREKLKNDETGQEMLNLKNQMKKAGKKKTKLTMEERFFQAGIFSEVDKNEYKRIRFMVPTVLAPLLGLIAFLLGGKDLILIGIVLGALLGFQFPYTYLSRKTKHRNEDIMFYLPLVIEQISIGVSSSLDINPCLQRVVAMADERDSHNVVTELVRLAAFYVKSGASLEEALSEVGRLSGHTELKHAFLSLAQVAKHGGEITRQLQELADAVAMQRETRIEEKIKKLELEATGPVALVFVGFIIILLVGFGIQMQKAF